MGSYSIWLLQTGEMPEFPRSAIFYGHHNGGTCFPHHSDSSS